MREGAPLLHERLASLTNPSLRPGGILNDDDPTPGSNLANHFEFRLGDVDKGFQEAEVIVEHETSTSPVHQGYIEPHTGTAMWNSDGSLTIWSSSQGHFTVRDQTARLMNVPVSTVRAIPHGDWRRLWWQDAGLCRARGGGAGPQGRAPGEGDHVADRSV